MNGNRIKKKLLLLGLVCLIPVVIVGALKLPEVYRLFHPYLDREISGPVTITNDWLEIKPKDAFKAERQINNLIILFEPSRSYEPDVTGKSLRLSDGSVATLEVELIDREGKIHSLTPIGISREGMILRSENSSQNTVYRAIRIKSTNPVKVTRIYWDCYNQWDVS